MAAGATYVPLASTTLSSDTGSVTFSSISSSYTDLVIIMSVQGNTGGTAQGSNTNFLRFNGDTASNYSYTYLSGNGTSLSATHVSTNYAQTAYGPGGSGGGPGGAATNQYGGTGGTGATGVSGAVGVAGVTGVSGETCGGLVV